MRTAFLGLGHMGGPMAANLARSGCDLVVWNRTPSAAEPLRRMGAQVADSAAAAIEAADTVIVMLADDRVVDTVLGRGELDFARLAGRTVVQMGTTSPAYSAALGADIVAAGGCYVEAPVSGSRIPAEKAELVAMVAGPPDVVGRVAELIGPTAEPPAPVRRCEPGGCRGSTRTGRSARGRRSRRRRPRDRLFERLALASISATRASHSARRRS